MNSQKKEQRIKMAYIHEVEGLNRDQARVIAYQEEEIRGLQELVKGKNKEKAILKEQLEETMQLTKQMAAIMDELSANQTMETRK